MTALTTPDQAQESTPEESSPGPSTARAATGRNVAALLSRLWRLRVTAAHVVPPEGPVLLVASHTAFLDVLFLAASCPRPVHVLTDVEGWVPPFDRALDAAAQIRYDATRPDRRALRTAVGVLDAGGVVGAFPEGSRGAGEVRHVHHGPAYLAARTGAVVVPVAVLGARPVGGGRDAIPRPRSRVDVVFGEPIDITVAGDPSRRAVLARSGERLRQHLSDHVELACRRTGQSLPGPLPVPPQTRSDA